MNCPVCHEQYLSKDTWEFLTGFYEGDGYLRPTKDASTKSIPVDIVFTQKDEGILQELKRFLGKGFIANHRTALELRVRDGVREHRALTYELLKHAQQQQRRFQLALSLVGVDNE